ncbi:hypothetical protein [Mesorhizobium sp. B4-1-3]|uniref:hypothetical protein n=1 Tax=Mesorhizobium sp. B4-1-3 TaxID=2589889 RepID=UPI001FEE087C|nr:hypothetical protein [Mesorhizobium sp. B4-1-3]
MSSESDRVARAGDYVFGLMNDRERARAERDLQVDPAFRDTVLRLAERLRAFDPAVSEGRDNRWSWSRNALPNCRRCRRGWPPSPLPGRKHRRR